MKNISTIDKKLQKLEEQKLKIQKELESLSKKRHEKVLDVLNIVPHSISLQKIIGGVIHIIKEIQSNPKQTEEWQKAGEKFLSSKKSERINLLRKKN